MLRRLSATISFCLFACSAFAGDADFIVKFATTQDDHGIYNDNNSDISGARPDNACGVGFGNVPGADDALFLGDIYASTAPNGLGVTQPFEKFPFNVLRVYFGGFGGGCGPTRVMENFNANPISFFDGETALWIEAADFHWITAGGVAIVDGGPSTPDVDFIGADDFVFELEQVWYLLADFDLVGQFDSESAKIGPIAEHFETQVRRGSKSSDLTRTALSAAQVALGNCARAVEFAKTLQGDGTATLRRENSKALAQEICHGAGRIVRQATVSGRIDDSLSK